MLKSFFFLTLRLLGLLGIMVLLPACSKTDDETALHQLIDQAVVAAEQRDLDFFQRHIAADFSGAPLQSRQELLGLIRLHWLRSRHLHVFVTDRKLQLNGEAAQVELIVLLAAKVQSEGIVPDEGRYLKITAQLQKKADWIVSSARWQ